MPSAICSSAAQSLEEAEQRFGSALAQALISLIADAEAFDSADEMIAFFGPDAHVGEDNSLSIAIGSDCRAKFVPVGVKFTRDDNGRADWTTVQRLKLVKVSRCP